jgi:hypothetical protein
MEFGNGLLSMTHKAPATKENLNRTSPKLKTSATSKDIPQYKEKYLEVMYLISDTKIHLHRSKF